MKPVMPNGFEIMLRDFAPVRPRLPLHVTRFMVLFRAFRLRKSMLEHVVK